MNKVETESSTSEYSYESDGSYSSEEGKVMELTEKDWIELYESIDILIYDVIEENIGSLFNPKLYKSITDHILDIIYETIHHLFEYDEEYEIFEEIEDLIEEIVEIEMDLMKIPRRSLTMTLDSLDMTETTKFAIKKQLEYLSNIPQPEQKRTEWYQFRYNLLSASNLWKVFGTEAQRNSLIYEKCKPLNIEEIESYQNSTSGPMHWGVKYEPITVMIYEDMYKTSIKEFGCIQHPKYNCIGASPDGINTDINSNRYGRMLEIKNIVNREITGIPKKEYWIQTQIQMETCDLEICDFVETRIKQYSEGEFFNDVDRDYKGVILHFIDKDIDYSEYKPMKPTYVYKPITVENSPEKISTWIEEKKYEEKNKVLFSVDYWYLDEFSCVVIERNRKWFSNVVEEITKLWDIVEKERIEGYEHRAAKKKKTNIAMCDVSGSYIGNLNTKASLCLIRLDENGNSI